MAIGFFDGVVLRMENMTQIVRPVKENRVYAMVCRRIAVLKYVVASFSRKSCSLL
jgi:hypothetical protein